MYKWYYIFWYIYDEILLYCSLEQRWGREVGRSVGREAISKHQIQNVVQTRGRLDSVHSQSKKQEEPRLEYRMFDSRITNSYSSGFLVV